MPFQCNKVLAGIGGGAVIPARKGQGVNAMIRTMMVRASVRTCRSEEPSREMLEAVVRAGQLARLLMRRGCETDPFRTPLHFTVCADGHRSHSSWMRGVGGV